MAIAIGRRQSRARRFGWLFAAFTIAGGSVAAAPAAEALPKPTVEFEAIAARDRANRDDSFAVFLIINNGSTHTLSDLELFVLEDDSFDLEVPEAPLPEIGPYGSAEITTTLRTGTRAHFGVHRIPFILGYTWRENDQPPPRATEFVTVTLTVARPFEDEAKGLPGGTAALLYLLLPVIPIFLGYEAVNRLRKGEPLALPTFKSELIVPAFFIAVVVNFTALLLADREIAIDYGDPKVFVGVLLSAFIVGAVFPGLRWMKTLYRMKKWGIKPNENAGSYLRKALLRPGAPASFQWIHGKDAGGKRWEGLLLEQPDGSRLLGAQLQVSPDAKDQADREKIWQELTRLLNTEGTLDDARRLLKLVEQKKLLVGVLKGVVAGAGPAQSKPTVGYPSSLSVEGREQTPLAKPIL